jgi:hypothetical protein
MRTPIYETVILGGGPAGTGSLVWAARHGPLGASPWGAMAGEASFRGQQSRWLYQHGLGEMIYNGTRQWAARQRASETSTPVLSSLWTRKDDHSEMLSVAPAPDVNPVEAAVRGS